jgi:AraC-like DNA-binding protein
MIYLQTVSESGLMNISEYRALMSNPSVMKESRWQKLLEDIQAGDVERTAGDVEEIFRGHRIRNASLPVLKMQLSSRLNELMTLYCDNNPAQDVAKTFLPGMETFLRSENLEEMRKGFQNLVAMTAGGIDQSDTLADQVCSYVQEHYADQALNISYLAEVFHRNPQTISRLFRAQKGQGLLDYISMVRVEQAKNRMKTSEDSLEKIASAVGFTNVRTFRRAFVKQYGVLPSEM